MKHVRVADISTFIVNYFSYSYATPLPDAICITRGNYHMKGRVGVATQRTCRVSCQKPNAAARRSEERLGSASIFYGRLQRMVGVRFTADGMTADVLEARMYKYLADATVPSVASQVSAIFSVAALWVWQKFRTRSIAGSGMPMGTKTVIPGVRPLWRGLDCSLHGSRNASRKWVLSEVLHDVLSEVIHELLCDVIHDVLSEVLHEVLNEVLCEVLSEAVSEVLSDMMIVVLVWYYVVLLESRWSKQCVELVEQVVEQVEQGVEQVDQGVEKVDQCVEQVEQASTQALACKPLAIKLASQTMQVDLGNKGIHRLVQEPESYRSAHLGGFSGHLVRPTPNRENTSHAALRYPLLPGYLVIVAVSQFEEYSFERALFRTTWRERCFAPSYALALEEIWANLNIEVLRTDEGDEVSMERRRGGRVGETGDPREDPPTNGIVRHDSHMRGSGVVRPGIEPGSLCWEGSTLTAQPPPPHKKKRLCQISTFIFLKIRATLSAVLMKEDEKLALGKARCSVPPGSGLILARLGAAELACHPPPNPPASRSVLLTPAGWTLKSSETRDSWNSARFTVQKPTETWHPSFTSTAYLNARSHLEAYSGQQILSSKFWVAGLWGGVGEGRVCEGEWGITCHWLLATAMMEW
ncbi:hypothetical protein PR048_025280 [Dryococelus australis]|uniref:Uncharacterized protein n=1 Tax=Dryococelus australis TaxID=614101 RepID=A0ABQ9GR08_9NEOP|nr:hypothetical protein PR048_025280 [Dryococelus australis]